MPSEWVGVLLVREGLSAIPKKTEFIDISFKWIIIIFGDFSLVIININYTDLNT